VESPPRPARRRRGLGLLADADEHGYLLAYFDGSVDSAGNRFWNATDACCNAHPKP
jgi:polyhydroxybutyrate depolymerase